MALSDSTFPQSGDANYAENYAQMIGQIMLSNYVEYGLGFSVDYTVPEVTVDEGVSFVYKSSGSTNDGQTLSGLNFAVQTATETVALTDGDVNYIYVDPTLGTNDSASIVAVTNETNAPNPGLKIGEVDTSADSSTELNREHPARDADKLDGLHGNDYVKSDGSIPMDGDFTVTGALTAYYSSGNLDISGELNENASL